MSGTEEFDAALERADKGIQRLGYGLAAVMAIYRGSDGNATRNLYAALQRQGVPGVVAINVLRACKCSERAKVYRGRGYRDAAYGRKEWSLGNLCTHLEKHADELGISWGWREDPAQSFHRWVLYVDLPDVGQVSYHAAERGRGPDYTAPWDGIRGAAPSRACSFAVRVLELPPPAAALTDREIEPAANQSVTAPKPEPNNLDAPPAATVPTS